MEAGPTWNCGKQAQESGNEGRLTKTPRESTGSRDHRLALGTRPPPRLEKGDLKAWCGIEGAEVEQLCWKRAKMQRAIERQRLRVSPSFAYLAYGLGGRFLDDFGSGVATQFGPSSSHP